jgi:cytochrome c oxidase assembly factor CtaG
MIKHLLLMTVAAPLILWGSPARGSLLGSARTLVLCWLAGTAAVIGWHVPAAFQLALGSHWWHTVENGTFLLAGLLFWWPVVEFRPNGGQAWSMPLYLFFATLPCDILSAFLVFCDRVVYPSYFAAPRLFDLSPLQDQEFAGALMWVSVTLIYLIPAVIITVQILSPGVPAEAEGVQT